MAVAEINQRTGRLMDLTKDAASISGAHKWTCSIESADADFADNTTEGFEASAEGTGKWSGTFEINALNAGSCPVQKGQLYDVALKADTASLGQIGGTVRVTKIDTEVDRNSNKVIGYVVAYKGQKKPVCTGIFAGMVAAT